MGRMKTALAASVFALACQTTQTPAPAVEETALHVKEGKAEPMPKQTPPKDTKALEQELVQKFGEPQRARIERGVRQVAALWTDEDGDLAAFARESFIADEAQRAAALARFERNFEQIDGYMNALGREMRFASEVDVGPMLPVDPLFAATDLSAHVTDDLFKSKLGFVVLLNWPSTTLEERLKEGKGYSREQWAAVRLAGRFARRVPAEIQQQVADSGAKADLYIAEYNVYMHHLVDEQGRRLFPKGLRLISHWNLRDELKGDYADKANGLAKQRMIVKVMERIVTQTIPKAVINNPRLDWNPFTNSVAAAPDAEVEADAAAPVAPAAPASVPADLAAPEPNVRYARLLAQFEAAKRADPFSPQTPTAIARSFELSREIPEERVKALLTEVLASPLVPKVAAVIQKRLGRPLEPQDLWYDGFKARSTMDEAQLDAMTRKRYPTADAFARDIPRILQALGFAKDKAEFVASHIAVDPSRGAGHAMQAMRRGDFPHLRTRVEKEGMNYKGYNIAVHELGHNVEQVFSLYEVDHTLLQGVPNSAFTEALAFIFQARDLELLGLKGDSAEAEQNRVLNDFWMTWEIAGVSLVDIAVWHWMYEHPDATPAQLDAATVDISKDVWNRYYAPVLGQKDTPLLGIYSHMIAYPLYLCDYPLGHLIAFQLEEHFRKKGAIGPEFERIASYGAVLPDLWMEHATGAPVTAGPLLRATEQALGK